MNRNFKDYAAGGRSSLLSQHLRKGHSLNGISKDSTTNTTDENFDLSSCNRRSFSLSSSGETDVSVKLEKISVGQVKVVKSGIYDLLTSTDGGKNDYDWLLTPPETPLFPSSEGNEFQSSFAAPRTSSAARPVLTTKTSRLSTTNSASNHTIRPTRSSSVTRSSIPSTLCSTYSSSILNKSSASVSVRPSSPATRSPSITRPSTLSRTTATQPSTPRTTASQPSTPRATASRPSTPRTTASRPSTPSKGVRTGPALPSNDRSRPSVSSRPSTPSSRPQISTSQSHSRPSTPSRRNTVATSSPSSSNYNTSSTGRFLSSGRSQSSASRPSSPGPRIRPQQPIVPPDFPLDTPTNMRTCLPKDRPVSAGRSRPGAAAKVNTESPSSINLPRRPSSPIVSRVKPLEPPARGRLKANGHNSDMAEPQKSLYSDSSMRKPLVKVSLAAENNGLGRTISKRSLDMAIRHMNIRNGPGSMPNLPSTSLYPQSVRSSPAKAQTTVHVPSNSSSIDSSESLSRSSSNMNANGFMSENGKSSGVNYRQQREDGCRMFAGVSEVDIFESSRYDAMILKEDVKNTNWLHSIDDDKSDQGPIFDSGFEALPEPFDL